MPIVDHSDLEILTLSIQILLREIDKLSLNPAGYIYEELKIKKR